MVRNIPIDLLRAFITVVDLKGFTRAGALLGRSQPAISLQIKRLQEIVERPLFVKDASVGELTEHGEMVATYARRMIALNDELMLKLRTKGTTGKLRIGLPSDYADAYLPHIIGAFGKEHAHVTLDIVSDISVNLLRDFRAGDLDLAVLLSPDGAAHDAQFTWRETLVWIGSEDDAPSAQDSLRLLAYPEGCLYRRTMIAAAQRDSRPFEVVLSSPSQTSIISAAKAGFGFTIVAERMVPEGMRTFARSEGFPELPDMVGGLYVSAAARSEEATLLATTFAGILSRSMLAAA